MYLLLSYYYRSYLDNGKTTPSENATHNFALLNGVVSPLLGQLLQLKHKIYTIYRSNILLTFYVLGFLFIRPQRHEW